mgnify:CR=1 FL=1
MENIILVDRALNFIDEILRNTSVNVVVLVVDSREQDIAKYIQNPRVKAVYTVAELDSLDTARGLSFPFIRACKPVQLRAENAMHRFDTDYNDKKYRYYMGLAFWHRIFEENTIDMVLLTGMSHGFVYDGVLLGVAIQYSDVEVYGLNAIGINQWNVFVYNHKEEKIMQVKNDIEISDMTAYLKNGTNDVLNLDFNLRKNGFTRNKSARGFVLKKTYEWFGYYGRELLIALKTRSFFVDRQLCTSGFSASLFYTFKSYYRIFLTHRYLKKHEKEMKRETPYIYYPLHFEPEATTQTRTTLESQLVVIKMIAECLPKGWKLLVKEHPHQYKLNNNLMYYMVTNGDLFKTVKYYQRIISIPNVELVSSKYDGDELSLHAQAVASLNGSALLEAIEMRKPVLLFSEYHPFVHVDGVFKCFGYTECEESIKKIYDGYEPNYENVLSVMNHYVSSTKDDLMKNIIGLINKEE